MRRLEGKVAMVTGCGGERGFGRAIARRLAAEGRISSSRTSRRPAPGS